MGGVRAYLAALGLGIVMSAHVMAQTPQPFPRPGETQAPRKPPQPAPAPTTPPPASPPKTAGTDTDGSASSEPASAGAELVHQPAKSGFLFTQRLSSWRHTTRGVASATTSTGPRRRSPTWSPITECSSTNADRSSSRIRRHICSRLDAFAKRRWPFRPESP